MQSELTHRERIRLTLEHRETDRVAVSMICSGMNPPAYRAFEQYLADERGISVEDYLSPLIDVVELSVPWGGPTPPERTDIWGVRRRPVSYGAGAYDEIEFYPLADASDPGEIAAHDWPSPKLFDYSALEKMIAADRRDSDHCLIVGNGHIFETSWYMRGFERMFMDLALAPDMADAIFERVTDFYVGYFIGMLSAAKGEIDLVFTGDDIAGQQGLLMSPEMWARHIKPCHERLNRVIHEFGARVIYHSDGAVQDAVPGLIEMGIDVLQALQFDAKGMDPAMLKDNYGDTLCFEGGVSVQSTLPFGTAEDVRREVRARIDVLGRGGGYILGPSHTIQAGTPPENIAAMFDTAATYPPPSRRADA